MAPLFVACGASGIFSELSTGARTNQSSPPLTHNTAFDINSIKSYHDIPGITEEEITVIETDGIENYRATHDFSSSGKFASQRLIYTVSLAVLLVVCVVIIIILLIKNNRAKVLYEAQSTAFSAIYSALPEIVFCKDRNSLYTDCNSAFEKMLGRDKPEIIGKSPRDLFSSMEQVQCFLDTDRATLNGKKSQKEKAWLTFPDGSRRFFEIIKDPLIQDGKITGLIGIGRDMTEHKQMTSEIESQNTLLETANRVSAILLDPDIDEFECNLINSMRIMADALGIDRVSIWKNYKKENGLYCSLAYEWLGENMPHSDGDSPVEFSYDEDIPLFEESLSHGRCLYSIVGDMLSGARTHLSNRGIKSIFAVPVFMRDKFWGFVAFDDCHVERKFTENEELILRSASRMIANSLIKNEMTQSIQAASVQLKAMVKEAQEANKSKSIFLAKMSHEIRTPMNAIAGMAELALREKEFNVSRKYVFTIKQACANLLSIINDILDISKIESGKLEILPDYYQLSSLMNDVINIIRMRAIDSQLRFVVTIDSNIPNELYGDETRIRQVLINVLGNAVKYTDEGFVSFNVTGEAIDENTVKLVLEVKDSGRGIKDENLDKLFSYFVQLDAPSNRNIEGTGLGLAISSNILKAMDGDIQAFSEYGKGSTFTITLPQKFRSIEKLAVVESPDEKNVIVFERRDIYADSIIATLDNLGVNCEKASDEAEFQKKLACKTYSFIFIAYTLYKQYAGVINESGKSSKIVLLAEFGEAPPHNDWSILVMPVHSISVSNILNGLPELYYYNEDNESIASFIAPDATVLVVDDIRTNLTVSEGLMLPYEMQIDLCKSGRDAIKAVQDRRYDLVFMDHWMPEMDGLEATTKIRALGAEDPYYKTLPIIALTANAISGTQDMFMENGFNGFLTKPIDTIKLNAVLEKWIPREKRKIPAKHGGPGKVGDVNLAGSGKPVKEKEKKTVKETIEIEGVDATAGIKLSGGSIERYYDTLDTFYDDGLEKIKELRICLEMGNIPLYTVHVHALKSAAANIGAVDLADEARALEMAGNQPDLDFIRAHNPPFLDSLTSLLDEIHEALSARKESKEGKTGTIGANELKSILIELKTAIEKMDAGVMNSTIDALLTMKLSDSTEAVLRSVSKHILMGEYDQAFNLTDSLLAGK